MIPALLIAAGLVAMGAGIRLAIAIERHASKEGS